MLRGVWTAQNWQQRAAGKWSNATAKEAFMTSEEQLIKRYFDAFNRHDLEGVVACFRDEAVLVAPDGQRVVGIAEVRRSYETEFAQFRDAHCELRVCTGNSGGGVAEPRFTGTPE